MHQRFKKKKKNILWIIFYPKTIRVKDLDDVGEITLSLTAKIRKQFKDTKEDTSVDRIAEA